MPRQGDGFSAVFEVIAAATGTWTLKCEAQTKNNEDADSSATALTGSVTLSTVTTGDYSTTGTKELMRFKFTALGDTEGTDKWIHFRTNAPIWQPN
jgi:hypothetical protein